jgi:hypothetical protein
MINYNENNDVPINAQIVVARYNENISHLGAFSNIVIVYNKGDDNIPCEYSTIKLPNIGRESHTYLYHIINNYDNLADKTLFIQGRTSDHKIFPIIDYFKEGDFIGNISEYGINMIKNRIQYSGKYLNDLNNGNLIKSKYTPLEWMKVIGLNIEDSLIFKMVWGANFSLSKKKILEKPKIFYQNLLKYVEYHNNPEEGHFFERAWYSIFNYPEWYNNKKIILVYNLKNNVIKNNILNKCKTILFNDNNIHEIHLWGLNEISTTEIPLKYIFSKNYYKIYNFKDNIVVYDHINYVKLDIIYAFNFFIKIDLPNILNNDNCIEYHFSNNSIKLFYNNVFINECNYKNNYINLIIDIYYENNYIILSINNNILLKNFIQINLNYIPEYYYVKNNDNIGIYLNNYSMSNIFLFNGELNTVFYKEHYEKYNIIELIEYLYQ